MLESLKSLDEIVIPYIEKERANLQLPDDKPVLLITYVFSGQMTDPVIEKIRENSIKLVKVPAVSAIGSDSKWGGKGVLET